MKKWKQGLCLCCRHHVNTSHHWKDATSGGKMIMRVVNRKWIHCFKNLISDSGFMSFLKKKERNHQTLSGFSTVRIFLSSLGFWTTGSTECVKKLWLWELKMNVCLSDSLNTQQLIHWKNNWLISHWWPQRVSLKSTSSYKEILWKWFNFSLNSRTTLQKKDFSQWSHVKTYVN